MAVLTRKLWCAGLILLLAAGLTPQTGAAETLQLQEQEIKAGLLYNFLKYIEWPTALSSVVVCMYGEDPFGGYLQPIGGRTVNQHEIKLRTIRNISEADTCQLLFVNAGEMKQWPQLHGFLAGKPVLTVSDAPEFAEAGGMIGFGRKNDHISVELNMEALKAAHLQVQDRLLRLVTAVHPSAPEGGP